MMDIKRCNLAEFFGCVKATNTKQMKSNVFKTFRTYLQEKSFAKWSDGQLIYVGDYQNGVDFLSEDGTPLEMKGMLNMFNQNGSTKAIDLKNFRSDNKNINKTFEYMLLVDTEKMIIAATDWDTVKSRTYYTQKSPTAKFKLEDGDYEVIACDIEPAEKCISSSEILDSVERIL